MHKLQLNGGKEMTQDKWLDWAVRLQAIAQTGLAYGKDVYGNTLLNLSRTLLKNIKIR